MKKPATIAIIIILCQYFASHTITAQIERPIGTNLTGIQDWSSEYVFVDVFKMSRDWIPHENRDGAPWQSEVAIPLGPNGYPLEIPYNNGTDPEQLIRTLMYFGDLANRYPGGMYRLIVAGTGQVRFWGAASGTFSCPVDTLVEVNSELGGIALEIEFSDKSDPVRDIHFIMPGFHESWSESPFHPDFLDFVDDFQAIRFMDWMKTNGSVVSDWTDRNTPDHFSQTVNNGIAYEYIIELCNLLKKDAWICIPHAATDDYIEKMAGFFRDQLDTELRIYLEYSNEVWNGIFEQNHFAQTMGAQLAYSGQPWEQGWQYYVKRTFDIFEIFQNQFGGNNRLIKVLAGQSANSWLNNRLVEYSMNSQFNPNGLKADAFAIAPYFGGRVADAIGNAGLTGTITVEAILDSMELALANSFDDMDNNKGIADQYEMDLICYEAGQHLVASHLYNNEEEYVDKLMEANRHPRMRALYCAYFEHWYDQTKGSIMCNFSSHGSYSKWGSWGVKEFMDELDAPKYVALQECVFSFNNTTGIKPDNDKTENWSLYPNPNRTEQFSLKGSFNNPVIHIYDLNGHLVKTHAFSGEHNILTIPFDIKGTFLVVLREEKRNKTFQLFRF